MPDSDENYPKAAQFIKEWYGQLGVKVTTQVFSSAALTEIIYPPEAGEKYTADYDIELWGWSGGVDPNGLLQIFRCEEIGTSSDSQYCNPAYDQLYADQLKATTNEARKAILTQMQNMIYDNAAYDILYYDANLEAYRTDRFAGWENQPVANGTPLFTYSTLQYTKLTDAKAAPTPAPSVEAPSAAPGTSPGASTGAVASPAPSPSAAPAERERCRVHGAAPGRGRGPGGRRGRGPRLVQSTTERGRGCGRGRVTGSARFGGPPATRTGARRSLTGAAG